ncbi:MAG TPA: hypothetical protein VHW23_43950 [Kofleriaceae bacterium]|jgi:hypothetical protein|nr:hypothetical protein [Kofleriaceae bacterium]
MRQLLLGMIATMWLGCAADPTAPEAEGSRATIEDEVVTPDPAPHFNQCVAGASCVPDDACGGAPTQVTCGPGKHCCNPVGCAGICEPATFCTAGNQFIDGNATCPNGGKCCITVGVE